MFYFILGMEKPGFVFLRLLMLSIFWSFKSASIICWLQLPAKDPLLESVPILAFLVEWTKPLKKLCNASMLTVYNKYKSACF